MVEPPEVGFTGVVWEARPADRLARELTTGPGSVPMAEAATAWGRLAAVFTAATADYDRIVAVVDDHWRSPVSSQTVERIGRMRHWLAQTAAAATQTASQTGAQATAYEIAQLAMPHAAEVAALAQARQSMEQVGAALGAPLLGGASQISTDADAAQMTAVRVMRSYEAAAQPLAQPWEHEPPPQLVAPAEASSQAADAQEAAMLAAGLPGSLPRIDLPLTQARVQPLVEATQETDEVSVVEQAQGNVVAHTASGNMTPAAMPGSAMGAQAEEERAGAAAAPVGEIDLDVSVSSAPPVLGAAVPRVQVAESAS